MKKIVHLIDCLTIGGAQTHLLTILKCVDRQKYEHIVYSLTDKLDIGREIEHLGIRVKSLGLQGTFKRKRWGEIIRVLSTMLREEKPDIVETHLTWSRIFGTIACVITGGKKIISFEHGGMYYNSWKYRLVSFVTYFFIDTVVACSHALKQWVVEYYGCRADKITVMHNAILCDVFKPYGNRAHLRHALSIKDEEVVICSIGTLGKGIHKGMNYCIEALSLLNSKYQNVKLLIVGDGELRTDLEQQAKACGLEEKVKFLGTRRDTPEILNAIDIFVLASRFEPFGIALIEAMATEKPVVGSASGGIIEIIEDGVNGFLFAPQDSSALAERIERLMQDRQLCRQMGIRARKSVQERFETRKYTYQLELMYERLLGKGN